jgi:hypothetical protein
VSREAWGGGTSSSVMEPQPEGGALLQGRGVKPRGFWSGAVRAWLRRDGEREGGGNCQHRDGAAAGDSQLAASWRDETGRVVERCGGCWVGFLEVGLTGGGKVCY